MPQRDNDGSDAELDCLIVGGGPAGLTAALYLARFRRRFLAVDGGASRAAWIPTSHNIPFFEGGISGAEILARQRAHAQRYGASIEAGLVTGLRRKDGVFLGLIESEGGARKGSAREVSARNVLLATGAVDIEPDLPDLPDAIQRGLVRYCPICDGYEASGRKIAVLGHGDRGLGEAVFIARTYSRDVTLLTLGQWTGDGLELDEDQRRRVKRHGVKVVHEPIAALDIEGDRISAIRTRSGIEHRFEVLYSALGLRPRSDVASGLGAEIDGQGALRVDDHNRTTVPGLYAAGGVVRGLDQVVVAMGHGAIAATDIHNRIHSRCGVDGEEEPEAQRA
jgi:thioredoxin reductase (NADPH)